MYKLYSFQWCCKICRNVDNAILGCFRVLDACSNGEHYSFYPYWFYFFTGKIPAPTAEDIAEKSERVPMNRAERKKVFRQFALPFSFLILFYTLLTAFRDFRDNFARELWDSIGYTRGCKCIQQIRNRCLTYCPSYFRSSLFYQE